MLVGHHIAMCCSHTTLGLLMASSARQRTTLPTTLHTPCPSASTAPSKGPTCVHVDQSTKPTAARCHPQQAGPTLPTYLHALLGVASGVAAEVEDAAQQVHSARGGGGHGVLQEINRGNRAGSGHQCEAKACAEGGDSMYMPPVPAAVTRCC